MIKFNQALPEEVYNKLDDLASKRSATVQEFLRNVVIPEWMEWKKKRNGV